MGNDDNLNFESVISNTADNMSILEVILNNLPFGISVQNKERKILYENEIVKKLVGSYHSHQCFKRWGYLKGEGVSICKDCPANISLLDQTPHKIFRKTLNKENKDLYLEIQVIPIMEKTGKVNKYIEIINDVSKDEIAKSLADIPISDIINDIKFSISQYGHTGGEIIVKDELSFFQKTDLYIQKLTMFTYIGIFQNNFNQEGLFGPLPVLDNPKKSMIVYSFRAFTQELTDPRRGGMEPCLLIMYFDRDYFFIFEKRLEILKFLNNKFDKIDISDLHTEWFNYFKKDFSNYLNSLLNNFIFPRKRN